MKKSIGVVLIILALFQYHAVQPMQPMQVEQNQDAPQQRQSKRYLIAACVLAGIGIAGGIGVLGGAIGSNSFPVCNPPQPVMTPCTLPATINPTTDMSQTCWSECVKEDSNPLLCDTRTYYPVSVTAGNLINALQKGYGPSSSVCLSTYGCSQFSPMPYNTTQLATLLYGTESKKALIKQQNKSTPKYLFKKRK